ncbi:MAG: Flp pilus assembly protein CpaB [Pseudomonadota bacterium]
MNKSVLMIMGGAFVIAIAVALLVQMKLAPKESRQSMATAGTEILVTKKTLQIGETLKATDVGWTSMPDNLVFKGMIKRKEQADESKLEVYNKPLRRTLESGEPVTIQAVVADAKGSGKFLSASISPGMRAVSVRVKAETAAGGFVAPGDYVDVILTYQVNLKGEAENYSSEAIQRFASETLLSNVRVLAVDQNSKEGSHEAKVARTITIEVSKQGAQILAMASTMGEISLSLRRLGEQDTKADQDVPLTTDVTTSRVIRKIYDIMDKSKVSSDTVRVYSGSSVTNVPVRSVTKP